MPMLILAARLGGGVAVGLLAVVVRRWLFAVAVWVLRDGFDDGVVLGGEEEEEEGEEEEIVGVVGVVGDFGWAIFPIPVVAGLDVAEADTAGVVGLDEAAVCGSERGGNTGKGGRRTRY